MEFSRQESWSGLPCPPPGDLPNPGTEPSSLASPALAGRFFATVPTGFTITYESAHSEGQDQNQDAEVTWNQRKNSEEGVRSPKPELSPQSETTSREMKLMQQVKGQTPIHDSRKLATHHPHSCPLLIPFTVSQLCFLLLLLSPDIHFLSPPHLEALSALQPQHLFFHWIFLTYSTCIPVPYDEKASFLVLVLEGLVHLHRIQHSKN